MKRVLPYRSLSEREVPEQLDARILSFAAARCRQKKHRRSWVWIGSIAAMLCVAAFTGVLFQMQQRSAEQAELLAMGDFSRLDQSGYNISFELASTADLIQY